MGSKYPICARLRGHRNCNNMGNHSTSNRIYNNWGSWRKPLVLGHSLAAAGILGQTGNPAPADTLLADSPMADSPAADSPAADSPAAHSPAGDIPAQADSPGVTRYPWAGGYPCSCGPPPGG
jgi:hypothetical protein